MSNRKYSLPPHDPYTPIPQEPRARSASNSRIARFRSASASHATPAQVGKPSKRHTYHELQLPHDGHPNPWNRVVSLPPTHPPGQSPGPAHSSTLQTPVPTPPLNVDKKPPGRPRRLENMDPRPLLRVLNGLLDPNSQRIPDFLDVDHILALYERDVMEREQRDVIKIRARMDRAHNRLVGTNLTVFGTSLREATMYASVVTILSGYEHDLPIIVFRCVKELCRHGFTNAQKQQKPDRDRLLALIGAFDSEPQFGSTTALNSPYELPEIHGLLTTYLFALPEPILSPEMFEAIWTWCILPSLRSTDFLEDGNCFRRYVPSDVGVRIAQILLRLLPLPNLSLIVYMMGFFQRLPHLVAEDVGRAVFAARCAKTFSSDSDGRAERAATMLRWFLQRWDVIFKELFPPYGLQQRDESSFEKPWACPRVFDGNVPAVRAELSNGDTPLAKREDLFEKANDAESDASSVSSSCALGERLLDVTMEIAQDAQDTKRRNRQAVVRGVPRELSGSGNKSESDDSGYESPGDMHVEIPEAAPPSPRPDPDEDLDEMTHAEALRRVSLLERELERSDVAVADAISETFRARERVEELEAKLRVREREKDAAKATGKHPPVLELNLDKRAADDWHAVLHSDTEALKKQLAEAQKERDAALQMIEEMKTLMKTHGYSL